ncbi:MAG: hypothetical protein IKD09_02475 [Lentisphaeria bacterium]|nr:hypothetical protein [Lentisphaeria bacterium]
MYNVTIKKKVLKNIKKLPSEVTTLFRALAIDLATEGPIQTSWHNYSKLGENKHHCHLNYHYVACWTYENETITVEVYYVGSRENAPY